MKHLDKVPTGATRSRFKAADIQIRLIRQKRGRNAHGDALLLSALHSVSIGDAKSALSVLEQFSLGLELSNEHRAIIGVACRNLKSKRMNAWSIICWIFKLSYKLVALWLALKSTASLNCKILFLYRLPVNSWTLAKLQLKTLPDY